MLTWKFMDSYAGWKMYTYVKENMMLTAYMLLYHPLSTLHSR